MFMWANCFSLHSSQYSVKVPAQHLKTLVYSDQKQIKNLFLENRDVFNGPVFRWQTELTWSYFWKVKLPSYTLPAELFHTQCRPESTTLAANRAIWHICFENVGITTRRLLSESKLGNGDGQERQILPSPHLKASDVVLSSRILFPTQRLESLPLWPMTEALPMLVTVQVKGHRVVNAMH